jgi:hypothetical protein
MNFEIRSEKNNRMKWKEKRMKVSGRESVPGIESENQRQRDRQMPGVSD